MSSELQERLQAASVEYQKIHNDLTIAVDARQKLDAQLSENELVKKVRHYSTPTWYCLAKLYTIVQEFSSLTPENTVYKLVGPVLVKQDQMEAKQNVDTRLDFIKGEMYVDNTQLYPYAFLLTTGM